MSYAVASVIEEYSLQHKIGYFMLDNASTNDVCVSLLCRKLNIAAEKTRRLRCTGHVLNLVVKAFLFGTDVEAFEIEAHTVYETQDELAELELWRRKGPVGKLH